MAGTASRTQLPISVLLPLTGTPQTLYTIQPTWMLTSAVIYLVNTTAGIIAVSIFVVPIGGSPTMDNAFLYEYALAAHSSVPFGQSQIFLGGNNLMASAGNTGVNVFLSGWYQ